MHGLRTGAQVAFNTKAGVLAGDSWVTGYSNECNKCDLLYLLYLVFVVCRWSDAGALDRAICNSGRACQKKACRRQESALRRIGAAMAVLRIARGGKLSVNSEPSGRCYVGKSAAEGKPQAEDLKL